MIEDPNVPSSLQPAPRPLRGDFQFGLSLLRLFSMLFCAGALAAGGYLVLVILWAVCGTNTTGHVVGTSISHGKAGYAFHVEFVYRVPAGVQRGEDSVDQFVYDRIANRGIKGPSDVVVRYFLPGPFHISGLVEFNGVWSKLAWAGVALLYFGFFAAGLSVDAWVEPGREKRLIRGGTPVIGAVTDKRTESGKKARYYVRYVYKGVAGSNVETEMEVRNVRRWQSVEIGQVVTILVDPAKPGRSIVYELSRYSVEGLPR